MNATLGPLEVIDGRCMVGEFRRPGGSWVEFRTDGLCQHAPDSEDELIPWSRIMDGISVILGRGDPSIGGNYTFPAVVSGLVGRNGHGGGHLDMTLRHPYEYRSVVFDRHDHSYRVPEAAFLQQLLTQTVDAGEARRLAEADWLGRAAERLAALKFWTTRREISAAVAQARQDGTPVGS